MPAFDTATTNIGTGISNLTLSHTAGGADRLAIAVVAWRRNDTQDVSAFTYGGSGMTLVLTESGSGFVAVEMRYFIAPANSSQTVSVTLTNTATQIALAVATYTGVHQVTPIGTPVSASQAGVGSSLSDTVISAVEDLCVDGICVRRDSTGLTPDVPQTQRANAFSGSTEAHVNVGISDEVGAASVTMGWTWTTATHGDLVVVPLKPVGGVPSPIPATPLVGNLRW